MCILRSYTSSSAKCCGLFYEKETSLYWIQKGKLLCERSVHHKRICWDRKQMHDQLRAASSLYGFQLIHVKNKTCILMPAVKCMASTSPNSSWYLFVHLQFCRQLPVWFSVRPADRGWYWIPTDDPSNDTVLVELNSAISIRYVSRTLYRGYYLPGWWRTKDNVFRYADPVTQDVAWCRYGELLAFSNYFLYWWTSYIAGDSLPKCALPVSQLLNGTSLYVVRYNITVETSSSGFYNHVAKSTYIVYGGGVANPLAVDILCGAGTWDLALFVCPLGMNDFFISCWKGWICIYIYIYIYVYIYRHALINVLTYTHTHTHTHAVSLWHTHTHTHTLHRYSYDRTKINVRWNYASVVLYFKMIYS